MTSSLVIHYYVHGRGRGHATRSQAVIRGLRAAGYQVRVFAGEDAQAIFEADATPTMSLPNGLRHGLPVLLRARVADAAREIARDGCPLVVSDGDLPPMVAARMKGVPSIAVGHGLVFACCKRPAGAPSGAWLREALKAKAASIGASHCVPVNFVSLPVRRPARTTLARPDVEAPPARNKRCTAPSGGPVVCYFRDGDGERVAGWVSELGHKVVLFGQSGRRSGIEYAALSRSEFERALDTAPCVISSAGSQLMSECLARGLPQLALYAAGDDEQALNAHMLGLTATRSRGLAHARCDRDAVARFLNDVQTGATSAPFAYGVPNLTVSQAVLARVSDVLGGPAEATSLDEISVGR